MITRMKQKLKSVAAETMAEVLVALLIALLGTSALAGMVMASEEAIDRAEEKAERIGTSESLMNTRESNQQVTQDGVSYDQYSNMIMRVHYAETCAPDLYVRYLMAKDASKASWTKVDYARYTAQKTGSQGRQEYRNAWSDHRPQGV